MSPGPWKRLSDERLGRRLAAGDAAAFDELYRRYVHRLAAYGAHLLGDLAAGEDVSHTTLLKAYQALRAGHGPERMRPWLYRIAHNAAIDVFARRRELLHAETPELAGGDPHEQARLRGALVAAIAGLPERQRRAYVLRELHGLRLSEIAAELGLNSQQVEQALFAARSRLAELIVFGGKLRCDVVRRLAAGELHRTERRALKGHLRTCPSCRAAIGRRAALALAPLPAFEWIRSAVAGLAGGSSAAKVGAVVATATIATGAPIAIHDEAGRHTQSEAPMAAPARSPAGLSGSSKARPSPARSVSVARAERRSSEARGSGGDRRSKSGKDVEQEERRGTSGPGSSEGDEPARRPDASGRPERPDEEAEAEDPRTSSGPGSAEARGESSGPGSGDRGDSSSGSSGPGSGASEDDEESDGGSGSSGPG